MLWYVAVTNLWLVDTTHDVLNWIVRIHIVILSRVYIVYIRSHTFANAHFPHPYRWMSHVRSNWWGSISSTSALHSWFWMLHHLFPFDYLLESLHIDMSFVQDLRISLIHIEEVLLIPISCYVAQTMLRLSFRSLSWVAALLDIDILIIHWQLLIFTLQTDPMGLETINTFAIQILGCLLDMLRNIAAFGFFLRHLLH